MEPENEEQEEEFEEDVEQDDEDGDEEAPEAEADDAGEAPEEEEPAVEPTAPFVAQAGEDDDDANLRNLLSPESYEAMRRVMAREMRSQMQAMTAANIHVTTAAAQNPELFRVHGARIQHNLAQLEPSLRSRPEAVNIAVAGLLIEEAKAKGIGPALAKIAGLVGSVKPTVAKAQKAPIPATQRPPSSSASSVNVRPLSTNREEGRIRTMMEKYGLSKSEAQASLADEGVSR